MKAAYSDAEMVLLKPPPRKILHSISHVRRSRTSSDAVGSQDHKYVAGTELVPQAAIWDALDVQQPVGSRPPKLWCHVY